MFDLSKTMSEDNEQIFVLNAKNLPVRVVLVALVLFALLLGWFAVRWQLGNLLADVTSPNAAKIENTAQTSKSLAPGDPLTNWLVSSIEKESDAEYTEGFENVVRLSPNDYRWWIQLGRAYEQADKPKEAEKAFLRAVEIAPEYTFPRWQIGNFYLRQDREEDAFRELKLAAEDNEVYREQIFSIAWEYYDQDIEKLEGIAGDSADVRVGLAKFYAAKERPKLSLEIWNTLDPNQKEEYKPVAKIITRALHDKGFMLSSVEFVSQLGIEKDAKAETVSNAGFENELSNSKDGYFNWRILKAEKMGVWLSPGKKKEGNRSLQVTFSGFDKIEINNIYQMVAVKPNSSYRMKFWVKTENLKSAGTPKLEVVNPKDNRVLASSNPFSDGTNDWKEMSLGFSTSEGVEGILLKTSRAYCGDKCPIVGTFWYDEFSLERTSGE